MKQNPRPVDEAEIVILVDNVADQARPGEERLSRQPLFTPDGLVPLVAEHGLSVLLRLRTGDAWRSFLLDAGTSGTAAVHNARALGVDLGEVEAVIVSHGHADHTAGLREVSGRLRQGTRVVVHPDAFLERVFVLESGVRLPHPRFDPDMYPQLEFTPSVEPTVLGECLVVTGQVPRVTDYEKGMPVQHAVREGRLVPDGEVRDDQSVVFVVRNRGAVVVSGCGHAGIVNTTRHALDLVGAERPHAILGGFHLCWPTPRAAIERTADDLASLAPDLLVPLHCTGREAVDHLATRMPDAFAHGTVGTRIVLG